MVKGKVKRVNRFITSSGQKRAYIKFAASNPAIDIATQMGLI